MTDERKNSLNSSEVNKPISAWEYFGRDILYAIPLIGLIVAIACAFDQNVNVRNHARGKLIFVIIWFAFVMVYFGLIAFLILGSTHMM